MMTWWVLIEVAGAVILVLEVRAIVEMWRIERKRLRAAQEVEE